MSTMISVDFPDGSLVSFDRARRQLIVTNVTGAIVAAPSIPARPNPPKANADVPLAPMSMTATVQKLGYKKAPIIHTEIWNQRYIRLDNNRLSYHESASHASPKGEINLVPGCTVRVIQANEPARKDRFEDGHNPGMVAMLTQPMGNMMNEFSTAIGKPNCVELHVPAQVGNMVGAVMNSSAIGMAFGGGLNQIKNARARSYYFSFDSLDEANKFAEALNNNIKIVVKANPLDASAVQGAGAGVRSGNMTGLNNAVNMAHAAKANMAMMSDPNSTLEWYKTSLNSSLPSQVIYEKLMVFYNQLAAAGINA